MIALLPKFRIPFTILLACWIVPDHVQGVTHVLNQEEFLYSRPGKDWATSDRIIVMGGKRIDFEELLRPRRNFSRWSKIFWLLSADQWHPLSMNKDQKVLEFASKLKRIGIDVVPENLCPKPQVFQNRTYDIIMVDSSWFMFQHEPEQFTRHCSEVSVDRFYVDLEEALVNAKTKPIVLLAHHSVHPKFFGEDANGGKSSWTTDLSKSLGSLNSIANPAYQAYQEKILEWMTARANILYVSSDARTFTQVSEAASDHLALSEKKAMSFDLVPSPQGVSVESKRLTDAIRLTFNPIVDSGRTACEMHRGPMHEFSFKGAFQRFFFGANHRFLWTTSFALPCFDLEANGLSVQRISGSLRAPDFELKDSAGLQYKLKPLKKAIRIPAPLQNTIVEKVMIDQQSATHPLGSLLAYNLSKKIQLPTESPHLVYIDVAQSAFATWQSRHIQSGYYLLVGDPKNLLRKDNRPPHLVDILSTKEMVHKLENVSGYILDQKAYLKARLFDLLIGDWDRENDHWYWLVYQEGDKRVIRPFPIDHEAAFYRANGQIGWWRRRPWINYKLQNYSRSLRNPEALMVQSLSIDHRFTFALDEGDWNDVVTEIQKSFNAGSMEQAVSMMPVTLAPADRRWLVRSFEKRLNDLPNIAQEMREFLHKSVDIVGTAGSDLIGIESGPGPNVRVRMRTSQNQVLGKTYDASKTRELRVYSLGGQDDIHLNWKNYTKTKIRLVPGSGDDNIVAQNQKMKPRVSVYDDDIDVQSYYGFIKTSYQSKYNDFYSNINDRKLNMLAPVFFWASSNPDTGIMIGGGIKYHDAGFQHSPWESTNELKGNFLFDRAAANIAYEGLWFDIFRASDFQIAVDTGLPRFYGSFFGLGNSPPNLNSNLPSDFYWLRGRHADVYTRLSIPAFQYISLTPQLQFRYRDFLIDSESFLREPSNTLDQQFGAGTVDQVGDANYYFGSGLLIQYASDDFVSGPLKRRVIRGQAKWMLHQGFANEDGRFQSIDTLGEITGFIRRSKTQWNINLGFGKNFGDWEFFDAQFLGQGQNLRGFFTNRFAGSARLFSSVEINQSVLFQSYAIITDAGIGTFFDNGRVFLSNDPTSDRLHKSIGGQAWVTFLDALAFKAAYAHPIFEDGSGIWTFELTTEL